MQLLCRAPIADYPFDKRRKMNGLPYALAELAVEYSVPDVLIHTISVERRQGDKILETLYSRILP